MKYIQCNPYAKIIEIAKLGQQSGVVKGILLHQGETNNGQKDWPIKVQKIYYDILDDLEKGIVPASEIFIRLASNLEPGSYSGSLIISSGGAQTKSVSLNGDVDQKVGVESIHAGKGEIVSTSYYKLNGQKVEDISLLQGVFIKIITMANGKIRTTKFLKL